MVWQVVDTTITKLGNNRNIKTTSYVKLHKFTLLLWTSFHNITIAFLDLSQFQNLKLYLNPVGRFLEDQLVE